MLNATKFEKLSRFTMTVVAHVIAIVVGTVILVAAGIPGAH